MALINQIASQALRGQSVKVTVPIGNIQDMQENYTPGTIVTCVDLALFGVIASTQYYGNSFLVTPMQPDLYFGQGGYLPNDVQIDVYNP